MGGYWNIYRNIGDPNLLLKLDDGDSVLLFNNATFVSVSSLVFGGSDYVSASFRHMGDDIGGSLENIDNTDDIKVYYLPDIEPFRRLSLEWKLLCRSSISERRRDYGLCFLDLLKDVNYLNPYIYTKNCGGYEDIYRNTGSHAVFIKFYYDNRVYFSIKKLL